MCCDCMNLVHKMSVWVWEEDMRVQLKRGIQLVLSPVPLFPVPLEILMGSGLGKGMIDKLVLLY